MKPFPLLDLVAGSPLEKSGSTLLLRCIKASALREISECVVIPAASADAVSGALLVSFERVRIPRRPYLTAFFHCHRASLGIQKIAKKWARFSDGTYVSFW